jgi:hypothetical protein
MYQPLLPSISLTIIGSKNRPSQSGRSQAAVHHDRLTGDRRCQRPREKGYGAGNLSVPKTPSIGFAIAGESEHDCWMFAIAFLFVRVLCDCFKSRRPPESTKSAVTAENRSLDMFQIWTPDKPKWRQNGGEPAFLPIS